MIVKVVMKENTEHIEWLRILENGIIINAVEVSDDGVSVDTHDDFIKVRGKDEIYSNSTFKGK